MKSHEARCACGGVQYKFTGEPYTVYACHCTTCQQRTGSAFGLSMLVPATSIEITESDFDDVITRCVCAHTSWVTFSERRIFMANFKCTPCGVSLGRF